MSQSNDSISDLLSLTPFTPSLPQKVTIQSVDLETDSKHDLDTARNNLHNILNTGADALDEILLIAKQSESARAFEVVATLMKTLVDANKDLVGLAKTKKEMMKVEDDKPTTINNNLYVGKTSDLIDLLKNKDEQ